MTKTEVPCGICGKPCSVYCIRCCLCLKWNHSHCIPLSSTQLKEWDSDGLEFVCPSCAFTSSPESVYNVPAALKRLADALESPSSVLQKRAATEQLLLGTYNVRLPPLPEQFTCNQADAAATNILRRFHPGVLENHIPLAVLGDGNCFYRALARGLHGHENHHLLIRLLVALEMASHPDFYNTASAQYHDLVQDDRIVSDNYRQLLLDAATPGHFAEAMHFFAASAALGIVISSYCPPIGVNACFNSGPLTRLIVGRGVQSSIEPAVTVMWSQTVEPANSADFRPNHFTVLHSRQKSSAHKDLTSIAKKPDTDCEVSSQQVLSRTAYPAWSQTPHTESHSEKVANMDASLESLPTTSHSEVDAYTACSSQLDQPNVTETVPEQKCSTQVSESQSSGCENSVDDTPVIAAGGRPLPLVPKTGVAKFLDIEKIVQVLTGPQEQTPVDYVPRGLKENVYFVVKNSDNLIRRQQGQRSVFWDDCGAWAAGSTAKSTFIREADKHLRKIILKEGKYCMERQKDRKTVFIPMKSQPDSKNVLTVHRYYAKHIKSENYEKRISWIDSSSADQLALYEYKGTFSGPSPHGSARKTNAHNYIRTKAHVMDDIKEKVKNIKPQHIYANSDPIDGPRNPRQIFDIKYMVKKNQQQTAENVQNFTDHMTVLEQQLDSNPFVQVIHRAKGKMPVVILHIDDQISDVRRFCCCAPLGHTTVLSFDKTFKLGQILVTVGVFKHLAVTRRDTGHHPLFFGPMLLHGDSDFDTFRIYFQHISATLGDTMSRPVLGSDGEEAMCKALDTAFPGGFHLTCTNHMKVNMKHYLKDNVGVPESDQRKIVSSVFGKNGIASANSTISFQERVSKAVELCHARAPTFMKYLQESIIPPLQNNLQVSRKPGLEGIDVQWTNEGLNHVLKQSVQWQVLPVSDLVSVLHSVVMSQYRELERSLIGTGDFVLCDQYKEFAVDSSVWANENPHRRRQRFLRFLQQPKPLTDRSAVSTDSSRFEMGSNSAGQVKRRLTAETDTVGVKRTKLEHSHMYPASAVP